MGDTFTLWVLWCSKIGEVLYALICLILQGETFSLLLLLDFLYLIFYFSLFDLLFDLDLDFDLYVLITLIVFTRFLYFTHWSLLLFLLFLHWDYFLCCKMFLTYIIFLRFYLVYNTLIIMISLSIESADKIYLLGSWSICLVFLIYYSVGYSVISALLEFREILLGVWAVLGVFFLLLLLFLFLSAFFLDFGHCFECTGWPPFELSRKQAHEHSFSLLIYIGSINFMISKPS